MLSDRSNFKLLAAQGKLYAVGGQSLGTVECYSPENDYWTCVSSMPDPLVEFSACECQGMIYVMGGYTARGGRKGRKPECPLFAKLSHLTRFVFQVRWGWANYTLHCC